ncbi:alpha-aminoadipic semialdehyde synthase isoform X2 [Rhodamnia argentea]|uniref:Alpha-aminoadipic semialdehyde synthase isoform X2 n=1 Tax=Rhodamnia argentea TaxID=178133 RepID=A0ABM3H9Q2_9MYRT|nr:alpha-aminoadipic semialdehyde synthase isoform X2 [Rhodamnia argentea]
MLGNGVVGILSESSNKWERRVPLTPSHCARLLLSGKDKTGVARIIVQPSTKRIHHDALYEDVGCEISDDLSECGFIVGIKQPKLDMILPDRAYAFFSHTHKAQKENMPLLDKIIAERASLYDYEVIVGEHGKRLLAFGKYAGRAGLIDFLSGLGQRYLSLGYSTSFLSLGGSYTYSSLAAAKAAIISVGEDIATQGLPSGICPLVFIFTGSGNVSAGAQEIFKLLPHTYVDPSRLPELFQMADYYAHPEHYSPTFHEKVAPYASIIVNCMYWEKRFPRLLSNEQLRDLMEKGCPLIGIADITCDVGGSMEFVNQTTSIESPFFRYDVLCDSYHHDMEGDGVICSAVDILPTEFAKEASQHFGDILSEFIGKLASSVEIAQLPEHLRRACIAHRGRLTALFEYIPRMRESDTESMPVNLVNIPAYRMKKFTELVSLSGHLFDKFLINEALNIIEAAGGSFHLVKCQVGQSADAPSYSELEVGADDREVLDQIIDSLNSLANRSENGPQPDNRTSSTSKTDGTVVNNGTKSSCDLGNTRSVLILGAGRVCQPAAELLASIGSTSYRQRHDSHLKVDSEEQGHVQVVVASLYLKDAEETIEGIPNATAIELDVADHVSLSKCISQVDVVISLLPSLFHVTVANACIELKKHLVTASYVDEQTSKLDEKAKDAGITILGEMGLDPGIDHMMAMKMIDQAHQRKGRIRSFTSYCGGLPSPAAANNPLAYKFSWNPAGAIRVGRNPALYKSHGETIHVDGDKLYESATRFRIPELPAFALECLPNRNSLVYGDLYRISKEASTIFRGTLRYEGFGEIMGTLAKVGLFDTEAQMILKSSERPTFRTFLLKHLKLEKEDSDKASVGEKEIAQQLLILGHCSEEGTALRTAKTVLFLGLHEQMQVPASCQSAFDVTCLLMEERLAYSSTEQDMVLLHHEVEVEYPESQHKENHGATLMEFGRTENGKTTTAMALTVGVPVAIGALLLLENKIKTRGVLRPIEPEVYVPALDILQAQGIRVMEKIE